MDLMTILSVLGLLIALFYITNLFNKGRSSKLMEAGSEYFAISIQTAKAEKLAESKATLEDLNVSIEDLTTFNESLMKL